MSLYLVTGGAGFIGSNIVEELLNRGERVRVIDNFFTGKRENLAPFINKIELMEGDIRDEEAVKRAVKDVDIVLHQAAFRSVPKSVENPTLTSDTNIRGTLNILIASQKEGVKRLVYASSSSVYGERKKFPEKEDDLPNPVSPYAVSKLAGEHYCKVFSKIYGLETVSLRYFNVFGPRQNPESKYSSVIPAFISRMLAGKRPIVNWDGKQSRDFTYIYNVVEANLMAAKTAGIRIPAVFNVACGKSYSILEIVKILNKILARNIKPEFAPKRKGDVRKTSADINKLQKILKIKTKVDFEEGLRKTVEWFKKYK